MAPEVSKRRKLEDGEAAEVSGNAEASAPADTTAAVAGMKRKQEQSATAPYSGESYKSSLFKLQVDEMLGEVKPDYSKRFGPVDNAMRKLKTLIEAIPARDPAPFHDATKAMRKTNKITVPHPQPAPPADTHYKLAYDAPSDINVVGSYPLKTMTKGEDFFSVDMVVTMPASILEEKDYLNHRYFYKRAYYLACLAAGIQEDSAEAFDLSFENMHGNDLHPVLIVRSGKGKKATDFTKSRCEIRIIPACPEGYFSDKKLEPGRNAIRPKTVEGEAPELKPTPFYNASLRADCNFRSYLKLLHSTTKKAEGFVDASALGRVWLRQRGFGSSLAGGGFGHFEWAALTALLLQGGGPKGHTVLSPGYSSYQLFKGVLQYIAKSNLITKPMFFQANEVSISKTRLPVFYDGPRGHNILFKMSASSYESLQDEARISIDMLNDEAFDQFEATFILKKDNPLQKFDRVIKIDGSNTNTIKTDDHRDQAWLLSNKIFESLKEALMNRVKLIQIKQTAAPPRWALKATSQLAPSEVLAGFVNDPEHINRAVDHGPPAEDKKAATKFRRFWGEKAELRRFKDGSILESLVWAKNAQASIPEQIIAYILHRHTGINPNRDLDFVGEDFDALLPDSENAALAFGALREELKTLERHIRDLEDIPLQLKQLSAISASLRSTSLNVPLYSPRQPLTTPAEVIITFEGSGRWPDDIIAIQRTKIAFLLKIAELLEDAGHGYKCSVGIENEAHELLNNSILDIVCPTGAAFRFRIHNEREAVLLEQTIKSKQASMHDKDAAVAAMVVYKYMFEQLPLLTQSISTHATRFPLLSPTIRLVKKWFASHLLTSHIREEFIELLTMKVFLQPYPWRAPSSAVAGFLRMLQFIARWDWRASPLVVDFSGMMGSKDVQAIQTRLEAWRKIDPAMNRTVIMAATNHDQTGLAFTDGMPSKVVSARMTALARSATKMLKEQGLELDAKTLFVPSLAEYDFVIHLSPKFSNGRKGKSEKKSGGFKNLEIQSEEDLLYVGFEPVREYVKELETTYGGAMLLLYNNFNGGVIAGLWSPGTATRPWRVNMAYATKMVDESNAGIDKEAIVAEMARLGGDMVGKIELRR